MKYRKKPVEIEAFRFEGKLEERNYPDWILEGIASKHIEVCEGVVYPPTMHIKTLEGIMRADLGDYIIKGVKGEIYPCKPDIFEMTYEKV